MIATDSAIMSNLKQQNYEKKTICIGQQRMVRRRLSE